jgi:hypothetical protein
MIKVNINKDVITITGHALYDDYGKDIVCSAVSSTVITTVNAILLIDEKAIKLTEKNGVKIEILHHTDVVDKLILNMINLLTELQSDYKDNINIRRC